MGYFDSQKIGNWEIPLGEIPTTGRLVWEFCIPGSTDGHFPLGNLRALAKAPWNGFPLAKGKYILKQIVENRDAWFC